MFCRMVCALDELFISLDAVSIRVLLRLTRVVSDSNDVAVDVESLLCYFSKVQIVGMGLNDTLLAVDLKEPIDASSSTAIKLDPVVPR